LAARWSDLDLDAKTLTINRNLEQVRGSTAFKAPKTRRGVRTITINDELLPMLRAERDRHLRIVAGIPDGVAVNLDLVKLPEGALIFPGHPAGGFDLTTPRNAHTTSNSFRAIARKAGFPALRFHDLRGTSVTRMLNAGIPVHIVARRHGHDPAVMMRAYAKALPGDDAAAARVMADMLKGAL
jgi:integrase